MESLADLVFLGNNTRFQCPCHEGIDNTSMEMFPLNAIEVG